MPRHDSESVFFLYFIRRLSEKHVCAAEHKRLDIEDLRLLAPA
jgi:hypothetical protein